MRRPAVDVRAFPGRGLRGGALGADLERHDAAHPAGRGGRRGLGDRGASLQRYLSFRVQAKSC